MPGYLLFWTQQHWEIPDVEPPVVIGGWTGSTICFPIRLTSVSPSYISLCWLRHQSHNLLIRRFEKGVAGCWFNAFAPRNEPLTFPIPFACFHELRSTVLSSLGTVPSYIPSSLADPPCNLFKHSSVLDVINRTKLKVFWAQPILYQKCMSATWRAPCIIMPVIRLTVEEVWCLSNMLWVPSDLVDLDISIRVVVTGIAYTMSLTNVSRLLLRPSPPGLASDTTISVPFERTYFLALRLREKNRSNRQI